MQPDCAWALAMLLQERQNWFQLPPSPRSPPYCGEDIASIDDRKVHEPQSIAVALRVDLVAAVKDFRQAMQLRNRNQRLADGYVRRLR
ncbi:hypothetical protein [Cupriavidus oxalaticus]|uniref:hypothetical protein n=1 Tax=Cupriavidus oxalaticus TaxID=96344 RepID=UPI003F7324B1